MRVRRLDDGHDMTFGRGFGCIAEDAEAVAQRVKTRLYLLLGEWFLDTSDGMPYLQAIMVRPADVPFVEAVVKQRILGTEGISTLTDFQMIYSSLTRRIDISCTVTTVYGSVANIKVSK